MSHLKNKLKYLVDVSLKRKICTKWFVIANVILALVIAAIMNIDSVIKVFGGDFNEKTTVYILDETSYSYDVVAKEINVIDKSLNEEETYDIKKYDKSYKDLKKLIEKEDNAIGIKITESNNTINATVASESYIDVIKYQVIVQALNSSKTAIAMSKSNIDEDVLNQIYAPIDIERIILDETKKSESENMDTIMSTVFPVFILPFFMLTIFLVQMIGAEVNDEKTTRGMEIIISNVSPKVHFASKVIAGNIFVIFQGLLLIGYMALGLFIRHIVGAGSITNVISTAGIGNIGSILSTEFMSKLIYIIPLTLVLMLLTFISYALLAGILASMTTNAEDFGQLQTPIMLILLLGYYLAIMAGMFKGAIFIRVLSYFPLISAILSPSLLVLGQIGIIDVLASIIIAIVTNYLLIHYGLKIYKVGILNYSSKDLWKKMFKAIKEK